MNDMELAEEIERALREKRNYLISIEKDEGQQIIAALRRGPAATFSSGNEQVKWTNADIARLDKALLEAFPERQPSGEMVMVPREPTPYMIGAAWSSFNAKPDPGKFDPRRHYRAMLSAAEAEGRKG